MTLLRGREELTHLAWRRQRVRLGKVKPQAVGHDAARVDDGHRAVPQRLRVEVVTREPVRLEEELRQGEGDRVLEVAALHLEVVLRQVHALLPDDLGQIPHLAYRACWGLMQGVDSRRFISK